MGRQWRVNVTLVREKIASGELAREIEPQSYKALKTAADVLAANDQADRQDAMRYLLNALKFRLTDDRDLIALLLAWQQEIEERLESLDARCTQEDSQLSCDIAVESRPNDIG